MSTIHRPHITAVPVRSVVPHILPHSLGARVSSSPRNAAAHRLATNRIQQSHPGHSRDSRSFILWGFALLFVILGGLGISKLLASSSAGQNFETVPIQIKVIVKGKPAPGSVLTLTSVPTGEKSSKSQLISRGTVGSDSLCSPSLSADRPGVPAGEYIATLTWCKVQVKDGETIAGPDLIPEMFRTPSTSSLRVQVTQGAQSPITLQVVDPKVRARVVRYDHE